MKRPGFIGGVLGAIALAIAILGFSLSGAVADPPQPTPKSDQGLTSLTLGL